MVVDRYVVHTLEITNNLEVLAFELIVSLRLPKIPLNAE